MRSLPLERLPGVRQLPGLLARRDERLVLFESWRGAYSDNPRAISETLHELRPEYRHLWVAAGDARAALPSWATAVTPGSRAYLAALRAARYVVVNTHMPGYFRKRSGTVYVQTWHGTPLKRLGRDMHRQGFLTDPQYLAQMRRDVASWDVLVSPNPFSTPIFRHAFGFQGQVVESGYPRNDLLAAQTPAAAALRAAVRADLGLGEGTLAILYAPTWRDGVPFRLRLDPDALARRVGRDHRLLVRLHPKDAERAAATVPGGAIDVSARGDIRDLYLAADVLVTDYSSATFDFAVTRKPMLFFTYDLEHYRDELRGFYFDFEREAPGPLLATAHDVAAALDDLEAVRAAHAERYAAFVERFCPLDDGGAAARVVDAVFAA